MRKKERQTYGVENAVLDEKDCTTVFNAIHAVVQEWNKHSIPYYIVTEGFSMYSNPDSNFCEAVAYTKLIVYDEDPAIKMPSITEKEITDEEKEQIRKGIAYLDSITVIEKVSLFVVTKGSHMHACAHQGNNIDVINKAANAHLAWEESKMEALLNG